MISQSAAYEAANSELVKSPIFLVEIEFFTKRLTTRDTGAVHHVPWLVDIGDLSSTVSDLDGSCDTSELTFKVLDVDGGITAAFPSFVFEGKKILLKQGFDDMDEADYITLFTGVIDSVSSTDDNQNYEFICTDNSRLLEATIYQTADDGFPTDSDHRRTITGHPLTILESILTTELGIDSSLIDTTKLHAYRDGIFDGFEFSFSIDSPPVAKDFIETELMKPLGGYLWTNADGKFTVQFFYPDTTDEVATFDEEETIEIPEPMQSDLINEISFRFDHVDDENSQTNAEFLAEDIEDFAESISTYGLTGTHIIESKGMRSGLQGFLLARVVGRLIFYRYGLKNLRIENVPFVWTACRLETGDIIRINSDFVPDRTAGVVGISKKFVVLDRNWRFLDGVVELTLIDASYLEKFKSYLITQNTQATYTGSNATDKATLMFLCNTSDQYSNGAAGNTQA